MFLDLGPHDVDPTDHQVIPDDSPAGAIYPAFEACGTSRGNLISVEEGREGMYVSTLLVESPTTNGGGY